MTKTEFLDKLAELYRVANASDAKDSPLYEGWTRQSMAGGDFCRHIDAALRGLVNIGVMTASEHADWIDSI